MQTQIIKPIYLSQIFLCKNKVRLGTNLVLQHQFEHRICQPQFKGTHDIVYMVEKYLQQVWVFGWKYDISRYSKYRSFPYKQMRVALYAREVDFRNHLSCHHFWW